MALESLKGVNEINGESIIDMDALRVQHPERWSSETGAMDYKWFESSVRPHNFIYVRHDVNSVSFTIQNGPVKEFGKNGCQVTDMIAVAKHIIEKLNHKFPCIENAKTLDYLDLALNQQKERTRAREARNVEGLSKL